ncbi:MAG: uracil phosphoribosyltransferase [Nitrososphaerota archaeon]|jgi:uracil phosphoribosyltransferase|nr:uracil phosphoribosyltransferase [Nitrososphaerota archaeon]MDG6937115.1 uracil phosphoribosyltransferase [Nitrososphaerota archaeon]MDG6969826.1 uracil phosphoribosyltransferase [Nitrososphaerota archaeon]MDG6972357.1 uracil phosphoribosyltransferase [Nitrososphaerota archaeon]MDG6980093.1 uracil phosphoribosyltransferase [Nitrososphaerota archaeon]
MHPVVRVKPRVTVVSHPMVLEQLTLARDKRTSQVAFRKAIYRLGRLMAYEFLRTLETEESEVETPLGLTRGGKVKGNDKIVIILVLRAAIPFVEGMYKNFPMARTGVISAWRGGAPDFPIEVTYAKIPQIKKDDVVVIADPMLATGHTLLEVARRVGKQGKPKRLAFFSVIATMTGINYVAKAFPRAEFYTCAVDPGLDEHGYIVPGLGDAGDRSFGTPR